MKKFIVAVGMICSFSVFANEVPLAESQGLYILHAQQIADPGITCAPHILISTNSAQNSLILKELDSDIADGSPVRSRTDLILGERVSNDGKNKEVIGLNGNMLMKQDYKKNFLGKFKKSSGLNISYTEAGGLIEKDLVALEKTNKGMHVALQCLYDRVQ